MTFAVATYANFLVLERTLRMAELKLKPLPPLTGIAGLGNIFKDAADAIEEVKGAGRSLSSEAASLAADIHTVRVHVRKEHEDFHFKVATLGNGGGKQSDEQEPPPKTPSDTLLVTDKDVGQVEEVTGEQNPSASFRS